MICVVHGTLGLVKTLVVCVIQRRVSAIVAHTDMSNRPTNAVVSKNKVRTHESSLVNRWVSCSIRTLH